MGACVSACVRMLTRLHDERVSRKDRPELNFDTLGDITPAEKQPSVLLVFSVVERQHNETKIVNFLRKVFQKAPGLVHQRNPQNETLLYFTCKQGKGKVIRYLLELCDPAETCPKGSAVHACVHAVHSGTLTSTSGCDVISDLLERGCDIDVQDSQGRTAFYLASTLGCYSAVKVLADRGCDVTVGCYEEMTALHTAAVNGEHRVVDYLLGLPGVSMAALDCHKRTPLTVTLMAMLRPSYFTCSWYNTNGPYGHYEREFGARAAIVERLLMAGADPNTGHSDREFVPPSSASQLCYVPVSLALCMHDIIKEERSKTYQRATKDTANNPGPRVAFPCPELSKLDAMNRLYGVTVATVTQILEHGAEVPHDDLLHYAPPLLEHLQAIIEGQNVQLSEVNRARPLALQKICRTCIRVQTAMGPLGFNGIAKLPVPSRVKQFLLFHQV